MSRFNTGNPLGSGDPRDLDDNAKNLDLAVNSEEAQWIDRFGRPRLPLMEQERLFVAAQERHEDEFQSDQEDRSNRFNDFIASSGYQFVGDYGPGIEITEYNQLIRDSNGEFWRLSGQVDLPYVTTGAGTPEDDALVTVGDAVLRQDLANPDKGAAMVARGVVAVDSIADLLALPEGQRKEGLRYLVKGHHAGSDVGGGEFYWSNDDHSTMVAQDPSGSVYVSAGDGSAGAFIRVVASPFYADWLGSYDLGNLPAFVSGVVMLGSGEYTAPEAVTNRQDIEFLTTTRATLNGLPVYTVRTGPNVMPPEGFPWAPPVLITERAGVYTGHIDLWKLERASKGADVITYYVDIANGSNGAGHDGLTPATAWQSIFWAFEQANAAGVGNLILRIAPGNYQRIDGWKGVTFDGNLTVICDPGVYITTAERFSNLTWVDEGGGVWSAVRSAVQPSYGVFDIKVLDNYGKPMCYTPVDSVGSVVSGTYYYDASTTTIYVRTADSRAPDEDLLVMLNVANGAQRAKGTVFVKGATFIGGNLGCFKTGPDATAVTLLEDCDFAGSGDGDGLRGADTGLIISKNCRAYNNYRDGFNYHDGALNGMKALEVDCLAWGNGGNKLASEPQNSNGTSAHEDVVIARVNSFAWENFGPNIADIGDTYVWCVGCRASDSRGIDETQFGDYAFTNNSSVWLEGCEGSFSGYQVRITANAIVKVRNWSGGYRVVGSVDAF